MTRAKVVKLSSSFYVNVPADRARFEPLTREDAIEAGRAYARLRGAGRSKAGSAGSCGEERGESPADAARELYA